MRIYITIICGLFMAAMAIVSCKRDIDIHARNSVLPLTVIEGNITNLFSVQVVTISKSIPYNSTNVFPPVSNAVVTISGNRQTYHLAEERPLGQYTVANVQGQAGQSYQLTVRIGKDTLYTATSVMPKAVPLDSIGVTTLSFGSKIVRTVSAFYRDPPGEQNQYRFILYVNDVQVSNVFAMDDSHTDGRVVNEMLYQNNIDLKSGDKVDVEMQCIDKTMYNYWYTLSQQGGNEQSSSAAPSNPTSNISNGALGYFSAHTTERKSLVIP